MQAGDNKRGWILLGLLGLLTLLSVWRLQDLARFMVDASAREHALAPHVRTFDDESLGRPFFPKHNCFTSYVIAQELALEGEENLYGPDLYRNPERETRVHEEIGERLTIDRYQYPPPFLLLPWALVRVGGGFFGARSLFFFLNLATFALSLLCAQRWLRGPSCSSESPEPSSSSGAAVRIWFAWPLVLLAGTTLTTLQIGNVHALVMVLAVLGMLAILSGRDAVGGALLGFLTVGKIFPGLLLVYLLARGKRRAVGWATAFGLLYALLTWALFGPQPFRAFFGYQLGRLASRAAFDFAFEMPKAMLVNSSVTGIAYRLQQLGVLADVEGVAKLLTWSSGFLMLAAAWVWGRSWGRPDSSSSGTKRHAELGVWLTLLLLAQMRSPFLPWGYGNFVVLWLLSTLLVAPGGIGSWRTRVAVLLPVWCIVSIPLPLPFGGPTLRMDFAFALLGMALALALAVAAILHGRRVLRAESPHRTGSTGSRA